MRRALAVLFAIALLNLPTMPAAASSAAAAADDRSGPCTAFEGVAFVFCVALCEARTCDRVDPADARCATLRRAFRRTAGAASCDDATLASAAPIGR